MRLQGGVLFVCMGEFGRFRTSWHTIGTLDWGGPRSANVIANRRSERLAIAAAAWPSFRGAAQRKHPFLCESWVASFSSSAQNLHARSGVRRLDAARTKGSSHASPPQTAPPRPLPPPSSPLPAASRQSAAAADCCPDRKSVV